jgi:hypothetical protein
VQPCGKASCTNVLRTTNGGDTWRKVGRIHAPLTYDKPAGVTEIRFADDLHGWAFGPTLWSTDDGGATWAKQQIPGGLDHVAVLAANADVVYAVLTPCSLNEVPSHCALSLWKTTVGGGSWTKTSLRFPKGLAPGTARISLFGDAGYVIAPRESDPDFLRATTNGVHWGPRPDPCNEVDDMLIDVKAISSTRVAFLCRADPGMSHSLKRVFVSKDTGHTAKAFGTVPFEGIESQLGATPSGQLFMTSWGAVGSWIYRANGGRAWTTPVASNDGGVGWNDVVMATDKVGFVVHGPAALFPGNRPGELGETTDGGRHWNPV